MIIEEIKNIESSKKQLRQFGIVMAVAFGFLGALFLWQHKAYYPYLFVVSALFFIFGITLPAILKPVQKIWLAVAILIGYVMTRAILSILFFLVFTPMGLVARLFGKQTLDLKMDRSQKSYWNYRKVGEFKRSNYERQF